MVCNYLTTFSKYKRRRTLCYSPLILFQSYQDESSYVGSFPKDFSYGPFEQNGENDNASLQEDHKPRILLMGLRRYKCFDHISV